MKAKRTLFICALVVVMGSKISLHFWGNLMASANIRTYFPLSWDLGIRESRTNMRLRLRLAAELARTPPPAVREPGDPPVSPTVVPHVLLLVVESFRADAIDSSTTPFLDSLRRGSWDFGDHSSTANCTPFSVFSIVTGAWPTRYQELPMGRLQGEGLVRTFPEHEFWTGNGVSWTYWDQDRTLFKGFRNLLAGQPLPTSDSILFLRYLGMRDTTRRPSLAFLMLNTTHYNYEVDTDDVVAKPYYGPMFDFRNMDASAATRLHARYTNAVHLLDRRLAWFFRKLRSRGMLDGTLILVTGDHGEEFFETGRLTHSLDPNTWESRVPLIVRWKTGKGRILHGSSHMQIPHLLALAAQGAPDQASDSGDIHQPEISMVYNSVPMPGRPEVAGFLKNGAQLLYMPTSTGFTVQANPPDREWSDDDLRRISALLRSSALRP